MEILHNFLDKLTVVIGLFKLFSHWILGIFNVQIGPYTVNGGTN